MNKKQKSISEHDQISACVRDGEEIPDHFDITAAATNIDASVFPEGLRQAVEKLQELWKQDMEE